MGGNHDAPIVRPIGPDESVTEAVVLAVSEATGRPPVPMDEVERTELGTVFESVDPEALDSLFRGGTSGGSFVFYWEGCEITVEGGTHVTVRSTDRSDRSRVE